MRSLALMPALAAMCSMQAQQIDGYRYWFDDNAASAVTTAVGATDELTLSAAWPTGPMAPGYHRVSFQVRDTNGDWSVPGTKIFVRGGQDIVGYRYWVNDDIGMLITGAVGPAPVADLNTLIDPGTLNKSFNTVTIQFMDADGDYTVPRTVFFTAHSGLVNGYQYWIDDDIANSQNGTVGPDNVVDLIADLPMNTTSGVHVFTIRFSGANGSWSVPLSAEYSFVTAVEELPGITALLLFPNPVTNELWLRIDANTDQDLAAEVLDASGRVVKQTVPVVVARSSTIRMDLSDLASGRYQVRLTGAQGTTSLPFVKI